MQEMICKYLHKTEVRPRETSYHLWIFAVAADALRKKFDADKHSKVLYDAQRFAEGNWMKFNGTPEESEDLDLIIAELQKLSE